MIEIIPAVMPKKYSDLVQGAGQVVGVVDTMQVDIMDGIFVPGKTWPFVASKSDHFEKLTSEKEGLPHWQDLEYEFDLMIRRPEDQLDQWVALGPKRIIIHVESVEDHKKLFSQTEKLREFIEIGLSFDDDTDVIKFAELVPYADFIQVMGIDEIGAQGQAFEPRSIYNLTYLHEKFPNLPLSVDGSVNLETIQNLVAAGATRLVAGSAVFASLDPIMAIAELRQQASI